MIHDQLLAIILGGGKGTRLYPLTKLRAKPAVPIAGKFRIIDITLSSCLNSNVKKIYVLTQFNTHSLHRHIYDTYHMGRFSGGFVDILAAQQTAHNKRWYQGTADAVRQNLNYITNAKADYSLVLSGDHIYRMDYKKFWDFHRSKKADISISVQPVSAEEATSLGILKTNEHQRIVKFVEKPDEEQLGDLKSPGLPDETPFLASMGIYLFDTNILIDKLNSIHEHDFGHDIIPLTIKTNRVFGYKFNGYWKDIGTIKSFFESNLELAGHNPPFSFFDEEAPVYTRARSLPGSRVDNADISNSLLADGGKIYECELNNTVIGLRSYIDKGSRLENVVMMGADYYEQEVEGDIPRIGIGKDCYIKNAIIDKNVRIGDNVKIINKDNVTNKESEYYEIKDGITVIPKNTIINSGTEI